MSTIYRNYIFLLIGTIAGLNVPFTWKVKAYYTETTIEKKKDEILVVFSNMITIFFIQFLFSPINKMKKVDHNDIWKAKRKEPTPKFWNLFFFFFLINLKFEILVTLYSHTFVDQKPCPGLTHYYNWFAMCTYMGIQLILASSFPCSHQLVYQD